jgi:hypothetical protein
MADNSQPNWQQYAPPSDSNFSIYDFPSALTPEERLISEQTGRIPAFSNTSSAGPSSTIVKNFEIKQKLLRPALTSHYVCRFQPPKPVLDFLAQGERRFPGSDYSIRKNQDLIELSCSEASLPGSSLMTNEITDDHTGVTERPAYRRQYDDRIDFTFYVDHGYGIINFFERWISYCAGENNIDDLSKRDYFYRVNFPDDYQTDALYIRKFERDYTDSALEYKFIRAYPISINSIPVSYDSSQLLKCTASFSFIRYVRNTVKVDKPQEPQQSSAPGVPTPPVSRPPIPGQPVRIPTVPFREEPLWEGPESGTPQPPLRDEPLW